MTGWYPRRLHARAGPVTEPPEEGRVLIGPTRRWSVLFRVVCAFAAGAVVSAEHLRL